MIIYFDGLACSGKTTLINNINQCSKSCFIVPEFTKEIVDYSGINTEYCRYNDEEKIQKAFQQVSHYRQILVDRCYISTLAYEYIKYRTQKANEFLETVRWYKEGSLNDKLKKPNLFVYIQIDAETSMKRAVERGTGVDTFAWFTSPQYATAYFQAFYNYIEPDVPLIVLNGGDTPEELLKAFYKQYQKFLLDNT